MLKYVNKSSQLLRLSDMCRFIFCLQIINDPNSNLTFKICYPFPDDLGPFYPKFIVMMRFACYYAIPLFIIGIFYVLIAKHLIHSASHCPGEMQGAQRQVINRLYCRVVILSARMLAKKRNSIRALGSKILR